jgi:UDP-N-acetylmuramoyl-L-alanyl-D-glutamate--2,6-diaminopimelate ligase
MESILRTLKKIIPAPLFKKAQPIYHYCFALLGAIVYRFPSREINIVMITGTKGKTSTAEIVNALLEEAGHKTALAGTLRFKIGDESRRNLYKMTMPGRLFIQRFLRQAVDAGCQYAIVEMTSEAAAQYRHAFIDFDTLIFLNISPEHIESHGGYENYLAAKLSIAKALEKSKKRPRTIIANAEDEESEKFLAVNVEEKKTFSIHDADSYLLKEDGALITMGQWTLVSHLKGLFNVYNVLAAIAYTKTQNIDLETIKNALQKLKTIRGRVEYIEAGQQFDVVVDYAHTADSLEKLYQAFPHSKKIGVLGNTGGGRDKWKRPEMAKVADKYCNEIILTNEDPYDEDPRAIVEEMAKGIANAPFEIIMDRRGAIHTALKKAHGLQEATGEKNIAVLITGKGTDPYIMEANGKKTPWDDAAVAREELEKVLIENQQKKYKDE